MAKFDFPFKKNLTISFQGILNCSWLLYLVFLLAAADLYVYAVNGQLFYVALFILIGILTAFFSKNMTVILLIAMCLTNIIQYGKDVRVKEGMEDGSAAKEDEGGDYQFLDGDDKDKDSTQKGKDKDKTKDKKATKESMTGGDKPSESLFDVLSTKINKTPAPSTEISMDAAVATGTPPLVATPAAATTSLISLPPAAASPIAAASPAAASPISTDVAKKLAGLDHETVSLLQKQQKLMENMENLKPLLANADKLLESFKDPPKQQSMNIHVTP